MSDFIWFKSSQKLNVFVLLNNCSYETAFITTSSLIIEYNSPSVSFVFMTRGLYVTGSDSHPNLWKYSNTETICLHGRRHLLQDSQPHFGKKFYRPPMFSAYFKSLDLMSSAKVISTKLIGLLCSRLFNSLLYLLYSGDLQIVALTYLK